MPTCLFGSTRAPSPLQLLEGSLRSRKQSNRRKSKGLLRKEQARLEALQRDKELARCTVVEAELQK
uniref:hypothetical protein n=1 Tax=Rhizobium sp. RCAM05350 TaxID=2895568 RepID=UPI00207678BD|nr:hypothetical protein [Rhizobium sp. RCAM05350]